MHTNLRILIEISVKIRMAKNDGSYLSCVTNGEFYFNFYLVFALRSLEFHNHKSHILSKQLKPKSLWFIKLQCFYGKEVTYVSSSVPQPYTVKVAFFRKFDGAQKICQITILNLKFWDESPLVQNRLSKIFKKFDAPTGKGPFFSENLMGLKKICQITILNLNFSKLHFVLCSKKRAKIQTTSLRGF